MVEGDDKAEECSKKILVTTIKLEQDIYGMLKWPYVPPESRV